jgi:hypothetical protein
MLRPKTRLFFFAGVQAKAGKDWVPNTIARRKLAEGAGYGLYNTEYICSCYPGWQGSECHVQGNFCLAHPCNEDGTEHTDDVGGEPGVAICNQITGPDARQSLEGIVGVYVYDYKCKCKTNFQGKNCDVDMSADYHSIQQRLGREDTETVILNKLDEIKPVVKNYGIIILVTTVGLFGYSIWMITRRRRTEQNRRPKKPEQHGNSSLELSGNGPPVYASFRDGTSRTMAIGALKKLAVGKQMY